MNQYSMSKPRKAYAKIATALMFTSLMAGSAFYATAGYMGKTNSQKNVSSEQRMKEHQGKRGFMKRHFKKMARMLDLTEEQRESIRDIFEQAKAEGEVHKESMKLYREQVKTLTQQTVFDQEAFTELHESFEPTRANIALAKAKTRHSIAAVLTEEQKDKLEEMPKRGRDKGLFN